MKNLQQALSAMFVASLLLAIVAGCEVVPCPPCGEGEACNPDTVQCDCNVALGFKNRCGGGCFNFQSDTNNCGACGKVCPIGEDCHNGQCKDGARPLPDLIGTLPVDKAGELLPDLVNQPSDLAGADFATGIQLDFGADASDGGEGGLDMMSTADFTVADMTPATPAPDLVKSSAPPDLTTLPDLTQLADLTQLPDLVALPDLWKCTPSDPAGCGGNCPLKCADGKACQARTDCTYGRLCLGNICALASYSLAQCPPFDANPPVKSCRQACVGFFGGLVADWGCSTSSVMEDGQAWAACVGNKGHLPANPCGGGNAPVAEDYSLGNTYNCGAENCACSACVLDGCGAPRNYCYYKKQ